MATAVALSMRKQLQDLWTGMLADVERLRGSVQPRPTDFSAILEEPEETTSMVTFQFRPFVLPLPERARSRRNDLFAVVAGRLSLDRAFFETTRQLRAADFGARASYFRRKEDHLEHVYGAHYDFAKSELGHPTFHSQFRPRPEDADIVASHFDVPRRVENPLGAILRNVRVPAAQMDVFMLVLQMCADHLLWEQSSSQDRSAFDALVAKAKALSGAAHLVPRLTTGSATTCYRGSHWYPTGI